MAKHKRLVRVCVAFVVVLASLGIGLLAAQDVYLQTDRLRRIINEEPDRTLLEYSGARSKGPGRIELDTLVLRIRDHNIELRAQLEGVSLHVALRDLLRRRLHVTSIRAKRLSFRLRERLTQQESATVRADLYPPIEGLPDPPIRPADEPKRHAAGRWRIVVDDLDVAQVHELWVDTWHWTGDARVNGGFELLPGREAVVGPARLTVASGALRRGEPVADGTSGEVWARLPRFSPREYPGNDVWKIMTGGARLRGKLQGLSFLTASASKGDAKLSGGRGTVVADMDARDGTASVRLDVDAHEAVYRTGARVIRGDARLDLRATQLDFVAGRTSLSGSRLALSNVSVDGSERSDPWSTTLRASAATLSLTTGALTTHLDGTFRDARPVVAMVPSGLGRWAADLLHLDGLKVSGQVRIAEDALDIRSARGEAGNVTILADYHRRGASERGEILVRKGILKVAVELHDGKSSVKPGLKPPAVTSFFQRIKNFFSN